MISADIPPAESLLVDSRFGVITQVVPYRPSPRMPRSWVGWSARAGDTRTFAAWEGERYGFGASLGDHDRARRAAVGEVVERYCGNAVPEELEIASYTDLTVAGRDTLDPAAFALYSDHQYNARGFPFERFTRDLQVAWVPGRDLHTGQRVLAPASMVYLNYFRGTHVTEPATHAMLYAGIATGENREHAERFALEELFERDANTIWWASGTSPQTVVDAAELLARYNMSPDDGTGRIIRLLRIPGQFDVPVLAAFIAEPEQGLISYGTACRADPQEAAKKALVEAFAMLELTAELADADSAHWRALARGEIPAHAYRPYRADRRYAEDFRPDFHDLVDLPAVAQLYLDPCMQGKPLDRLRDRTRPIRLADIPVVEETRARQHYLDILAERNLRAVSVDVTTSDVRAAGLTVVRVIVPGLYCNPPAAFPYLGGSRLYTAPTELGWVTEDLTEDTLYPYPIPHV
ncbi:SagD family biosynthesis docking scaffold protein [Candidatus Protofrankia californiensis]|uniref:SagD family biosynthesis docking scaffold protein n=1 Tax=Candidatus Protofrankia californiensis TaxID=1839754 RepID=A0A1C3NYC6_9ACTN|nr:SagD family biosynthesis docking scaffold protein [Candidatus Protofrankia californiensis]